LEREDGFARLIHWFDGVLESLRGNNRAQVTAGIDNHSDASSYGRSTDPGNISLRLTSAAPDADGRGVTRGANAANIDVEGPGREGRTGEVTQPDVVGACGVTKEGEITVSRVVESGRILGECACAGRGIGGAGGIGKERLVTIGRQVAARLVI